MELFAIHCTTCKARLKVTDESVIGHILSCPKCQSMVMVEPPSGWRSGAVVPVAAQPVIQASPITKPSVPPKPALSPASVLSPPPLPARPTASAIVAPTASMVVGIDLSLETPPSKAFPREWWPFAGGVSAGVVIGAVVWMLIAARSPSNQPIVAAIANAAATEAPVQVALQQPVVSESSESKATEVEVLKPVVEEAAPTEVAKPQAVEEPATEPIDEGESPSVEEPAVTPPLDENQQSAISNQQLPASPAAVTTSIGPPRNELASRLRGRVPKVAFEKMPLRQFAAFIADFSGAKIMIDVESLKSAGLKSLTVTVHESDVALDKLLQSTLEKLGLACESRGETIVIFAPK